MTTPILCFDLEGTLLDRRGWIHPQEVALLETVGSPAVFILATGRLLGSVSRALTIEHIGITQAPGNVFEACQQCDISRTQFYEYKRRFQTHGLPGLRFSCCAV